MAEAYKDGDIVNQVLDQIGWPTNKRDIDITLGTEYPKWWQNKSPLQIIHDLELISLGFFYVDHRGYAIWEGRNTRSKDHATSEATFDDTMVDLIYELEDRDIYNEIIILAEAKETSTIADPVIKTATAGGWIRTTWGLIPSAERTIFTVTSKEPALSWSNPHVIARKGDIDYSHQFSISIYGTPTSSKCKVKMIHDASYPTLYFKAEFLVDYTYQDWEYSEDVETVTTEHTAEDIASQIKYKKRTKRIDLPFRMDAQYLADALANFYLSYYKEPIAKTSIILIGKTDELLTQILARHVSDRITVVHTGLGLSADFYINKVSHKWSKGLPHRVTWELQKIEDVVGEEHQGVWILETSKLGISTILDIGV